MTMSMYHVIKAGGLNKGGCNFDAKVRRQSFTADDMVHAHVGGADLCARAFLTAAKLIEDGGYDEILAQRYAGWKSPEAVAMLEGKSHSIRSRHWLSRTASIRSRVPASRSKSRISWLA